MPTTVTKSIGTTGRDYSTLAAFAAAIPTNLVTADQKWVGECYNDSEFAGTGILFDSTGHTTDATRFIVLTAAAGQSFQDHANVRTNPLKYDASKGVGIRKTDAGNWVLRPAGAYTEVRRLQVKGDATDIIGIHGGVNEGANRRYKDCIVETQDKDGLTIYDAALAVNITCLCTLAGGNGIQVGLNSTAIGCNAIQASDQTATGNGFRTNYGTNIMQSCCSFGWVLPADATNWDGTNSKNNATNSVTGLPGVSNQHSVTFNRTTPFTDAISTSPNLIAIASTSLAGNGFKDATNAPNDITGTVRAASPTIGSWEITSSGAAANTRFRSLLGVGI